MRPNRLADPMATAGIVTRGVTIARGVCDQPYGCRDFDVEDRNGYRLCFGQNLG
jgi:hypothetical protein